MFARRVHPVELTELVFELSPAAVLVGRPARLGQPEGVAPFVRYASSVRTQLPTPVVAALCDEITATAPRVSRRDRFTLTAFASFLTSGFPAPPGLVRDALCLLAIARLGSWLRRPPHRRGAPDRFAVELVVAALGVASLGEIRAPR